MAHAPSFDDVFNAPPGEVVSRAPDTARGGRWWASWEAWLTLSLIVLAQVPVVGSLQSSDWVEEMPSLAAAALIAAAAGWLLAQSPLPAVVAGAAGAIAGGAVVVGLVLQRLPVTDPALGTGWGARWAEFVLRMEAWLLALWEGGISTDALPFVVLLVAIIYVVMFLACWSVVRWQNAWAALIPGGIILLTNISYLPGQPSIAFIFFLVAAVLLVTRMEFLRAGTRWRREHVAVPDYMSLQVIAIGVLVAMLLVGAAWFVPTANHWGPVARLWDRAIEPVSARVEALGQLFVGINAKREVPVHALGPSLPLQGKVSLGSTPLYRVSATEPGNLRGAVYDAYTGTGWKVTEAAAVPLSGTTVQAAELGTQRTKAEVRRTVTTQVEVLSPSAPDRRLLSVGDAITASVPGRQIIDPTASTLGVVPSDPASPGKSYTTVGTVSAAAVSSLLAAGTSYPQPVIDAYTGVPATTPPEVAQLAKEIAGNARTPYEAARRIEAYLRRTYQFTLDPPPAPPRRDAVAAFLFDQRAGYFDQFASSMAVMLRTLGIPARVATGFALDQADVDPATKLYTITEQRAWSWPEVYFPNLGWVEFNPTPSRPLVARAGDDSSAVAEAEAARANPEPSSEADASADEFADGAALDLSGSTSESFLDTRAGQILVRLISTVFVLSVAVVVIAAVARLLWQRRFAGLRPAAARWAKVHTLASWAGIAAPEQATPSEAAAVLGAVLGESAAMQALARAYTRDRYGRPEAQGIEDEQTQRLADREYRRVRDQLRRRITARILHVGHVPEEGLARRYATARVAGR